MGILLLVARLLLAGVVIVAGLAKLVDRAGSHQALRDFGLPDLLATPLGMLLPLAELAVGVALVPRASAWWGAIGALALLGLFSAGIAVNLARGRTPECHCFGQLHSAPVGWPTLSRNLVLAAVAGFVVWRGQADAGASAIAWLGALTTAQYIGLLSGLIVAGLLAVEGWFVLQLLRQNGRLLVRLQTLEAHLVANGIVSDLPAPPAAGLPVGTQAPTFALSGLDGQTLTLDTLRAAGKPVVLIFTNPRCHSCASLLPDLGRWQHEQDAPLTFALISRGALKANRTLAATHGLAPVLLQRRREVMQAYQAPGTPAAVLVQPDGTIGSPLALGAEEIRALVARTVVQSMWSAVPAPATVAAAHSRRGPSATLPLPSVFQIGDPAPDLALPSVDGKTIRLADLRGRPALVLFWDPDCAFCQQMLADLRAWERTPPPGAPQLLVVSTGTVEANRALGLRAPVVLDRDWSARRRFGALGTPMAVLVDAAGNVASELTAGAPAILALAGYTQATEVT